MRRSPPGNTDGQSPPKLQTLRKPTITPENRTKKRFFPSLFQGWPLSSGTTSLYGDSTTAECSSDLGCHLTPRCQPGCLPKLHRILIAISHTGLPSPNRSMMGQQAAVTSAREATIAAQDSCPFQVDHQLDDRSIFD